MKVKDFIIGFDFHFHFPKDFLIIRKASKFLLGLIEELLYCGSFPPIRKHTFSNFPETLLKKAYSLFPMSWKKNIKWVQIITNFYYIQCTLLHKVSSEHHCIMQFLAPNLTKQVISHFSKDIGAYHVINRILCDRHAFWSDTN